jgi:hypothetical protein
MANNLASLEWKLKYHLEQASITRSTKLRVYHTRTAAHYRVLILRTKQIAQSVLAHVSKVAPSNHSKEQVVKEEQQRGPGHLVDNACHRCMGSGQILLRGQIITCNCVYRRVFMMCLRKHKEISDTGSSVVIYQREHGPFCELVGQDYVADFELLAHHLPKYGQDVFWFHFLLGYDWRNCLQIILRWYAICQRNGHYLNTPQYPGFIDRGGFFHEVYRTQQFLGRLYMECGLFPFKVYFHGGRIAQRDLERACWKTDGWDVPWLGGGYFMECHVGSWEAGRAERWGNFLAEFRARWERENEPVVEEVAECQTA